MRKGLLLTALAVTSILSAGCSTTRPPAAPAPEAAPATLQPAATLPDSGGASALPVEMRMKTDAINAAGGLAALGTGESKSLDLALNYAKKNGRIELAQRMNAKVEALAKAFSEETGIPYHSLLLSGFNTTAKALDGQIAASLAQALKYQTDGNTFTAYAIIVLDPKDIAARLAKEPDLYARLQKTKTFEALNQEIKAYEAFQSAQK
jgi:hypothetical protein